MVRTYSTIYIIICNHAIVLLTTVALSTAPPPASRITASLNPYLEDVFTRVTTNPEVLNLVPFFLPNVSMPLTSKWYFPYKHLTLTNGVLQNLQSLKRKGNCSVSYSSDEMIEIVIDAAFTDLQLFYYFEADSVFSWFSLDGLLKGNVQEARVNAVILVDAQSMLVRAKEITFPDTSKLHFSIESTILATWVVNLILQVVSLFSGFIIDGVQTVVTNEFNDFVGHRLPDAMVQLIAI